MIPRLTGHHTPDHDNPLTRHIHGVRGHDFQIADGSRNQRMAQRRASQVRAQATALSHLSDDALQIQVDAARAVQLDRAWDAAHAQEGERQLNKRVATAIAYSANASTIISSVRAFDAAQKQGEQS